MIEEAEAERALFTRIQQDLRHQHVFTSSKGPGSHRWLADWQTAFGQVELVGLNQTLRAVERGAPPIVPLENPHLQMLVEGFGLLE